MIWRTLHLSVDGVLEDRDGGWPELEMEIEPIGRLLAKDKQTRQLHVKIGKTETVIGESDIQEIIEFLQETP